MSKNISDIFWNLIKTEQADALDFTLNCYDFLGRVCKKPYHIRFDSVIDITHNLKEPKSKKNVHQQSIVVQIRRMF